MMEKRKELLPLKKTQPLKVSVQPRTDLLCKASHHLEGGRKVFHNNEEAE